MKTRCNNPKSTAYSRYGGKGISVCKEWTEYVPFKEWSIKNGYKEDLEIDRLSNNKGYNPKNCRWVNLITQANNRGNSNHIEYGGISLSLPEWARKLGVTKSKLKSRYYKHGWSIERILTTP